MLPASFGGLRGGAQIFVKTLSGKTIAINDINITDSVGELARNVCRRLGFPPDADFYFVFGGHVLRDENLDLWIYNIHTGSTVFMVMRLRGGAKADPFCKKQPRPELFRLSFDFLRGYIKIACYLLVLPLALYISLLPCL